MDYESEKYFVSNSSELREKINEYGVAIYPSLLRKSECEKLITGMWDFYENLTEGTNNEILRDDESTWKNLYKFYPKHSFLQQHFGVGHAEISWKLRQNPKIYKLFARFWEVQPEDLIVSFDGFSFGVPHEKTNRGYYRGKAWYHTDQSFTRNDFECLQSWVTGHDVNEGDATLTVLEGSNNFHAEFSEKFNIKDKNNWNKLDSNELDFFLEKGCRKKRIVCPRGSLVFWDSRTIHCGVEALREREKENFRTVIYLCYQPRSLMTESQLRKKQKAFNEVRTTNHWPCKPTLFAKNPYTYGGEMPEYNPVEKPVLKEIGKKLAGF